MQKSPVICQLVLLGFAHLIHMDVPVLVVDMRGGLAGQTREKRRMGEEKFAHVQPKRVGDSPLNLLPASRKKSVIYRNFYTLEERLEINYP